MPLLLIFISKGYFFSETPCVPVCDENQRGEREVGEVLVAPVAVTQAGYSPDIYAEYDTCSLYKDIHLCLIYYICHICLI